MNPTISIIIPFLNEEDNIEFLVNELENYFQLNQELTAEVIFVNDGSTDNSLAILKKSCVKSFKAKIISLSKNYGSHAALRAGIFHANGNYIGFMYADLQDPLILINEMYNELIKDYDICWATRKSTENGLFEKTFSKFYSSMMKKYAMPNYPDNGFDIVMFNKKVQMNLNQIIESNSSVFLQILNLGYKQNTISYNKQVRKNGKSKWTVSKKIKLFIDSFVAFSFAPIRFVTIIGFILFAIGLMWSTYVIVRKVCYDDLISGWPTLISILLIGFGITNISLGIIAEYLWRTMDYSRNRPVFIIDEIIEIKNGKA
jgi:glycosyltransferase involved in cell wall biosynthesis